MYNYEPNFAIPPMETLKETLECKNISLSALSRLTGLEYQLLEDVMEVRRPIDKKIAERLEDVLGVPAKFWLKLEENYQSNIKRLQCNAANEKRI